MYHNLYHSNKTYNVLIFFVIPNIENNFVLYECFRHITFECFFLIHVYFFMSLLIRVRPSLKAVMLTGFIKVDQVDKTTHPPQESAIMILINCSDHSIAISRVVVCPPRHSNSLLDDTSPSSDFDHLFDYLVYDTSIDRSM